MENSNFTENEIKTFREFATGMMDVSKIMIDKIQNAKNNLSKTEAKEFSKMWDNQDAKAKVNDLKSAMNDLNKTMKGL